MRILQNDGCRQRLTMRAQFAIEQQWIKRTSRCMHGIGDTRHRRNSSKRIHGQLGHVDIPPQSGACSNSGSVLPWAPLLGYS